MSKGKPTFSDAQLSGKKSLSELGITEADAQVPEGWKRVQKAEANCENELQMLFEPVQVKAALRQALRRTAQGTR